MEKPDTDGLQAAFEAHPYAVLAYTETPANPAQKIVGLRLVADIAHTLTNAMYAKIQDITLRKRAGVKKGVPRIKRDTRK